MESSRNVRRNILETNERELHRIVDRQAYVERQEQRAARDGKRKREKWNGTSPRREILAKLPGYPSAPSRNLFLMKWRLAREILAWGFRGTLQRVFRGHGNAPPRAALRPLFAGGRAGVAKQGGGGRSSAARRSTGRGSRRGSSAEETRKRR